MGRVVTLSLSPDLIDAVGEALRDLPGAELDVRTDPDARLDRETEAVVIGADTGEVALVRRVAAAAPAAAIVIAAAPRRIEEVREALQFSLLNGNRVELVSATDSAAVGAAVRAAAAGVRAARRTRLAVAALNARIDVSPPPWAAPAGELLDKLLEHAPIGVVLLDADGRVRAANRESARLLERPEVDLVGSPFDWRLRAPDRQRWRELLDEVPGAGVARDTLGLDTAVGRLVEAVVAPLAGAPGAPAYILILQDVTDRQRALEQLAEANRRKDEFLAMLGHELRNPLAPILTAVQILRLRGDPARELQVVERQVQHLSTLVNDLLDVARITRGRIALSPAPMELSDAVARGIELAEALLEQKGHHLVIEVPTQGLLVAGDVDRLAQVVANLLTNAARYTDPGGTITVAAAREGDRVALRVRDTGRGISADMLPHIFDLFSQAPQAIDRKEGGLGIGLAIVASLVKLHGGHVSARSEVGQGSEFEVLLPALQEVQPDGGGDRGSAAPAGEAALRVLVVDDNEDIAALLAEALSELGYSTRVAHDGPSALQVAADFCPDVALLDIGLPVMDGYEVGRALRRLDGCGGVELVAISGYGQPADRARSAEEGFRRHLAKPIDLQKVQETLEEIATDG